VVEHCKDKPSPTTPPEVKKLLEEYKDVFGEPKELPPARAYDHAIPLIRGTVPVNS
jgi:acetylornithine deacetylase/succinyl-diaminopimelate desuccinylase-like protein